MGGLMKTGSLFSGYGGLDMAVNDVFGSETAWFVEFDKAPSKILAHHWPDVPNYGDITAVDWSAVEPVDILTGGSPCQDLSHAGKRAGMTEGTRSNLWVAMREAIAQLRPGLVVWENVRGAYSAAADSELESCAGCVGDGSGVHLRALGRVLGDLSDLGYDCRWHGLRAADVGAPHRRFRVFVVAHRDSTGRGLVGWINTLGYNAHRRGDTDGLRSASEPATLLPTPAAYDADRGGPQHPDKRRAGGHSVTLQDAIHGLAGGVLATPLLPTPAVNDMGEGKTVEAWDEWTAKMQAAHGNGNGHGKSLAIEAQRLEVCPDYERCPISAHVSDERGWLHAHQETNWGIYADAIGRWEALTRPAPAPTQPSKKGTPQLSPAFSEWLMGLPAGHVTDVPGLSRNDMLKALGNGVVPQQAAAALRFLLSVEVAA